MTAAPFVKGLSSSLSIVDVGVVVDESRRQLRPDTVAHVPPCMSPRQRGGGV